MHERGSDPISMYAVVFGSMNLSSTSISTSTLIFPEAGWSPCLLLSQPSRTKKNSWSLELLPKPANDHADPDESIATENSW